MMSASDKFINKNQFCILMNHITEIITAIKKEKNPSKKKLNSIKKAVCRKYKTNGVPTDTELFLNLKDADVKKLKSILLTKPTRTISGVAIVAIMTKPSKCPHGKCAMCPGGVKSVFGTVPQSYTGKEPATRRAIRNNYDPYLQVMNRLEQYIVQGHPIDKVELIIMGGTFPSCKKNYQEEFVKYSLKAMNDFSRLFFSNGMFNLIKFKEFFELPNDIDDKKRMKRIFTKLLKQKGKANLEKEQLKNESSNVKCIGMTIETRPDYGNLAEGNEMLRLGCTRVELGIQSVYDDALKKIERGHSVKDSINSIRTLKDLGFKLNFHMMLGMPSINEKKDLEGLKELFKNEDFQPDMLKLYPLMVLKGTKIYDLWKNKKYIPLSTEKAAEIIAEFKKSVPEYVRIMRVQRDIPTFMTEAGVGMTNLRQYIDKLMQERKIKCSCIRCREIKSKEKKEFNLKVIEYKASKAREFFIQAVDSENNLYGFCRLRFPSQFLRKEITELSALVRELHVYGPMTEIGEHKNVQHKGIGRILMKKAEEITRQNKKNKIIVISGIGAREYYKKLGYKREGVYMVKNL